MTLSATQSEQRKLRDMSDEELAEATRNREAERANAEMAATVATERRDEAVVELKRRGVRNSAIARLVGCSPTRVTQILARAEQVAA